MNFLSKHSDTAYALLRIVAGFMFLFHGSQKLFRLFGAIQEYDPARWFPKCGFRGIIRAGRWGSGDDRPLDALRGICGQRRDGRGLFPFHWRFAFGNAFFPIVNHGEMAVLYCFLFLFHPQRSGGGKWSFDNAKGMKKKK